MAVEIESTSIAVTEQEKVIESYINETTQEIAVESESTMIKETLGESIHTTKQESEGAEETTLSDEMDEENIATTVYSLEEERILNCHEKLIRLTKAY